jgi:hypothetical protein
MVSDPKLEDSRRTRMNLPAQLEVLGPGLIAIGCVWEGLKWSD